MSLFFSILFPTRDRYEESHRSEVPSFFKDLNLDQIFAPILKSKKVFNLEGYFYNSLRNPDWIEYRQHIMKDLERDELRGLISDFSLSVFSIGNYLTPLRPMLSSEDGWKNNYLTRGQMLDYADQYCRLISSLAQNLDRNRLHSNGLRNFYQYINDYKDSTAFQTLSSRVQKLRNELSTIEYCMLIKNGTIRVRKYEGQVDHSKQILATFEKFRQGDVKDYRHKLSEEPHAAHVEAAVLNLLAGIYKDIFADLDDFCNKYINFEDETIMRFSREIQFYLSWLDYIVPLQKVGLQFCYPKMSQENEHIYNLRGFDLALARIEYSKTVVNDFIMDTPERIIVVTGPNQGGKTTYARQFGQVHYLASLGLCVPGSEASLCFFDGIYTHFGREEDLTNLNGKLQDDLVRLHMLLEQATSQSIVVINEIFSSTTIADALTLGGLMMDKLADMGALAVLVTFLDELALHGPETISMMSTVEIDDPSRRTFKIIRKPPDGLAYAQYIATKHGLTYTQLCGRLKK